MAGYCRRRLRRRRALCSATRGAAQLVWAVGALHIMPLSTQLNEQSEDRCCGLDQRPTCLHTHAQRASRSIGQIKPREWPRRSQEAGAHQSAVIRPRRACFTARGVQGSFLRFFARSRDALPTQPLTFARHGHECEDDTQKGTVVTCRCAVAPAACGPV